MDASSSSSTSSCVFSEDIADYDLKHEIGVGSFGRVYEAIDRSSGRPCAVKKIKKSTAPNPKKIETEVTIQKRARHENIVRQFRAIEDDDYVYLVMELCAGGSLKNLIKSCAENNKAASRRAPCNRTSPDKKSPCSGYGSFRRSNSDLNGLRSSPSSFKSDQLSSSMSSSGITPILSYPLIRSVLRQLCRGLDYLHRNNVVHRDLNANNILLETRVNPDSRRSHTDIRIKIADFGLALDMESMSVDRKKGFLTGAGTTICGTPGFISPEVWRQSSTVSPASDVFSLGSILYSMLTGVTSPKGDLNVSSFPPLLANLLSSLMNENPEKRLHVKDILEHPFTLGPLDTTRLPATSCTAKNQRMTIQEDRSVVVSFLEKDCSITVSKESREITIRTRKNQKVYTLENLPPNRWKWYARVHDFVRGIKSTTPKIKKFCKYDCNVSSIDGQGNRLTIIGGVLSESSSFKIFVHDEVRGTQQKTYFDAHLKDDNPVLYAQARDLYEKVLRLEDTLESLSEKEGEDFFPFTSGKNPLSKHAAITTATTTTLPAAKSCISSRSMGTTTTSARSQSVTVDDVTSACKVPDGFMVNFSDGSSLMYTTDSQITYSEGPDRPKKRFHASNQLPAVVQQKLSVIPAIINPNSSSSLRHRSLSSSIRSPTYSYVSC